MGHWVFTNGCKCVYVPRFSWETIPFCHSCVHVKPALILCWNIPDHHEMQTTLSSQCLHCCKKHLCELQGISILIERLTSFSKSSGDMGMSLWRVVGKRVLGTSSCGYPNADGSILGGSGSSAFLQTATLRCAQAIFHSMLHLLEAREPALVHESHSGLLCLPHFLACVC